MATPTNNPPPPTATATMKPPSAMTSKSSERIATHTHVTGLGLDPAGLALPHSSSDETVVAAPDGWIGQGPAREACGLVVDLVKSQRFGGRAVLLVGPPGSGKTALALGMAKALGKTVPFVPAVASQVYSKEVVKTEILTELMRQAIGLRIREEKEVYEGQVTELTVQETEDPTNTASYGRTISHVVLGLKTTKGTKTLKLDPTLYEALSKEQVTTGDVIYIEANSGRVQRVGRSDAYATEFDLESEDYVPIPKGDVHKKRQVVQDVTLHDLDLANAQPTGGGSKDVRSLVAALGRPKKTEMTDKLRQEINKVVQKYMDDGVAELVPGVLFLDEVHMLDPEAFTFLHRACLESALAPVLVLATNRGMTALQGSSSHLKQQPLAPHGVPTDFLDRLLIVPTRPYSRQERMDILQVRAKTEGTMPMEPEALQVFGDLAMKTSLRHALQLLTTAQILAQAAGRSTITAVDVQGVDELFLDAKASALILQESQGFLQ